MSKKKFIAIVILLVIIGVIIVILTVSILNKEKINTANEERQANLVDDTVYSNMDNISEKTDEITETKESIVDGIKIPAGFYYVGGTKDTGLVISDKMNDDLDNTKGGNQFVWIPVNYSDFQRYEGYANGNLQTYLSNSGEADSTGINQKFESMLMQETETTKQEAMAMYASVQKYGGFYIGRYEAGKGENNNVVVKKGADVYNCIQWSANGEINETNETTGGAVELARNFDTANGYTSVTSTLIYGVQWDAIMQWIDPGYKTGTCSSDSFVVNSIDKGNYTGNIALTGSSNNYMVNNIYDLAGNVDEWTMESFSAYGRNCRGSAFSYNSPVSSRGFGMPGVGSDVTGFRVALYIQ